MQTSEFDYELPGELVAQVPAAARDESRLLVLRRESGLVEHRHFAEVLSFLRAGDVLVLNDSRVIPARVRGLNARSGGRFELLLLRENVPGDWWAMVKPGRRAQPGTRILLTGREGQASGASVVVTEVNAEGHRRVRFEGAGDVLRLLEEIGEIPLPPYIVRGRPQEGDRERYQTVYAAVAGSVAAPTAGLHFTAGLLERVREMGVRTCAVTLHVGVGTFAPVKADYVSGHVMHEEIYFVPESTAETVNGARAGGHRVIAVGTTSVRVLESVAAANHGRLAPGAGATRTFIYPPYRFRLVDGLLTNFHLPRSTLLMLVSAFTAPGGIEGRETVLRAYREAVREKYRFFSYGDAMLIV